MTSRLDQWLKLHVVWHGRSCSLPPPHIVRVMHSPDHTEMTPFPLSHQVNATLAFCHQLCSFSNFARFFHRPYKLIFFSFFFIFSLQHILFSLSPFPSWVLFIKGKKSLAQLASFLCWNKLGFLFLFSRFAHKFGELLLQFWNVSGHDFWVPLVGFEWL